MTDWPYPICSNQHNPFVIIPFFSSAYRDINDNLNDITFNVPIHMMHIEGMPSNVMRTVALGLKIGTSQIWSALHEINIVDYAPGDPPNAGPVIKQEIPPGEVGL